MKRILLIAVALVATMSAMAQNIAVVSPSNVTKIYQTLDEAITNADSGSTIYLPGGGFQIKDETNIGKKLTIMGVSYRGDTDNVDGATIISGNLTFVEGSSGSAVLGIYVSGDIIVGTEAESVTNLTIRYCNVNSIQVKHSLSSGMVINQCYLRKESNFGGCNVKIFNSIINFIKNVNGGNITYNINLGSHSYYGHSLGMDGIKSSIISANIFRTRLVTTNAYTHDTQYGVTDCQGNNNYGANWGDDPIEIEAKISDLFVNWNNGAISPASDFHFKNEYKEYENKIGIYAGDGFNDDAHAPIPRIVSKKVAEQSDGSGKLKIEVTVKAN